MNPGDSVRRTAYDLSAREKELMPMIGEVVSVAGGVVTVQWSHRTKGKVNRYYLTGQRIELNPR